VKLDQSAPVCPYCGFDQSRSPLYSADDIEEGEDVLICFECDKYFHVEHEITHRFGTKKANQRKLEREGGGQ
jgi:hypothetical protein